MILKDRSKRSLDHMIFLKKVGQKFTFSKSGTNFRIKIRNHTDV